ncbi:VOC family protein [Actinopolymorpha sp. NPDC004070]|uniref:VOC family protein n=1 Tax=Actinopolymorpha sp. NPDC004070 TaxID=3154548 RepID=UPI0033A3F779
MTTRVLGWSGWRDPINASRSTSNDAHVTGYCCLRLPVRDVTRSTDFYCDVIGYARSESVGEVESLLWPAAGAEPGLYLMKAAEGEFRHHHWEQWGELFSPFELSVVDLDALQRRLEKAGAEVHREPHYKGGYLTMGFFDPDGHYLFAVDRRGRYFCMKAEVEELLGRVLSEVEDDRLQLACAATGARDEMDVVHSIVSELRRR